MRTKQRPPQKGEGFRVQAVCEKRIVVIIYVFFFFTVFPMFLLCHVHFLVRFIFKQTMTNVHLYVF